MRREIWMLVSSAIISGALVYHASTGRHQLVVDTRGNLFRINTIYGTVEHIDQGDRWAPI